MHTRNKTKHKLRKHSVTQPAGRTRRQGSCRSLALLRIGAAAQVACNPDAQRGRWRHALTQQCHRELCGHASQQSPPEASRGTGASCRGIQTLPRRAMCPRRTTF